MADAEAAGRAREATVGDESDLVAHALAVERCRRGEHLAHTGTAARPFVADHQDLAFLVLARGNSLEAGLLAVEAAGRTPEHLLVARHAGHLHDGSLRSEIALQPDDAAGGRDRLVRRIDHILIVVP